MVLLLFYSAAMFLFAQDNICTVSVAIGAIFFIAIHVLFYYICI